MRIADVSPCLLLRTVWPICMAESDKEVDESDEYFPVDGRKSVFIS